MSKRNNSGTSFLVQGSILAIASIVSRIIGLIYRLPMTDIIGDQGNNYYSCAFDVYNVVLIISSFSLPTAVSKLVSTYRAKRQKKMVYQILKGSLLFALITGGVAALVVFFGAEFFTGNLLKTPYGVFALRVLAPVLLIVAILGVLRGFFQGMGTMMPSAISQILEQLVNAVVSVWASYVLFSYGAKIGTVLGDKDNYAAAYGAAGGTLGTSMGAIFALLFLLFILSVYLKVFKKQMNKEGNTKVESFGYVMHILLITIIPVLLSTTIYNISDFLDHMLYTNIAKLQGMGTYEFGINWGVYSGKYRLLINVPIAISSALAASSVPALTNSFQKGDLNQVRSQIDSALRFVMIIAFPCTVGLAVLGKPILLMLFPSTTSTADLGACMMATGAIAVIFYSISTLTNGMLQGIDRMQAPVKNAAISLVLHVIILIVLMMVFHLDIHAVVIANALFSLFVCILNGIDLYRFVDYKQEIVRTFLVPGLCSLIMGVLTFTSYQLLLMVTDQLIVSLAVSFILAVISYFAAMFLLKGITEKELSRFPKGDTLVAICKKLHLF